MQKITFYTEPVISCGHLKHKGRVIILLAGGQFVHKAGSCIYFVDPDSDYTFLIRVPIIFGNGSKSVSMSKAA